MNNNNFLQHAIRDLAANKAVYRSLLTNLTAEEQQWKPEEKRWSLLEVICHLHDEEKEDFRTRLKWTLETPLNPFPPIDPSGWVQSRHYAAQDFRKMLNDFLNEREDSILWLETLEMAPWENVHQHPTIGPMSARFILANWLAHDLLHIRQIVKLKYDYLMASTGQSLGYAGNW